MSNMRNANGSSGIMGDTGHSFSIIGVVMDGKMVKTGYSGW